MDHLGGYRFLYKIHVNSPPKRAGISTSFSTQVGVLQPMAKTVTGKFL